MATFHEIRYPSLELNWLPNSITKNIPTPRIVVTDSKKYSGVFYHPQENKRKHGLPLDKGLIEVSTCGNLFESTIAHEFRHHWQLYNGTLGEGNDEWLELFQSDDTYKLAIIAYFKTQPHEMDALCFERNLAPNEYTDEWWEWIVKS